MFNDQQLTCCRTRHGSRFLLLIAGFALIVCAAFSGAASTAAHAQSFDDFPTSPPPDQRGDYGSGNQGSLGGGTIAQPPMRPAAPQPARPASGPVAGPSTPKPGTGKPVKPRRVKRCTKRKSRGRSVKTCSFYANERLYKRCVTKHVRGRKRTRCHLTKPSARPGRKRGAKAARLTDQYYTDPSMGSVGRLYPERCTATMISRTLAVTAAHCLYNLGGTQPGYVKGVSIYPGMTWSSTNTEETAQKPYGQWLAYNWWVPDGYKAGDEGLDFGLVEFRQTTADGRYLGDVTGYWDLHWSLSWNVGTRIYGVGYPAEGYWATAAGHWGVGQYACDSTWDGERSQLSGISRSGTMFLYTECTMNGGSSGGPWFVQLANGNWVIGAIEARGGCFDNMVSDKGRCVPYARYAIAPYLDGRFGQFWHSIVG